MHLNKFTLHSADVLIELTTDKAEVKYAIDMINSSAERTYTGA